MRALATIFLAALTAGCTVPRAEVAPDGRLEIFGPASVAPSGALPDDWIFEGYDRDELTASRLRISVGGATPRLTVRAAHRKFLFARHIRANLLASPYLRWSWNMGAHLGKTHPVHLVIGFFGGDPAKRDWRAEPLIRISPSLPRFDRAINVVWGNKTLGRGSLDRGAARPSYIARGGIQHADAWWTENLDLARIYAAIWPGDDLARVAVKFVAIASDASAVQAEARFSDLTLFR